MSNKTDLEKLTQEERAAVEARREYQRKWRSEHKDNVREHNKCRHDVGTVSPKRRTDAPQKSETGAIWLKKARQIASENTDTD